MICTEPFAALARATASGLGLPQLPLVLITHPLAGAREADVAEKATEAYTQVPGILTAGENA